MHIYKGSWKDVAEPAWMMDGWIHAGVCTTVKRRRWKMIPVAWLHLCMLYMASGMA
jgi:hypothetical protein